MTGYLEQVRTAVTSWDADRPRSRQTEPGWSEAMDCRAALGYKLSGEWETDTPDMWRALVGTLLHDGLSKVLGVAEVGAVAYRGLPGHPDHVEVAGNALREWKFPTLAVAQSWQRTPEAFAGKRAQAHGYAAGLIESGMLDETGLQVTVLVMPVDGTFADWWEHTEPFNRDIADQAVARVAEVRQMLAAGELPPRDKPVAFCERFCEWFTACRGDDGPVSVLLTDAETTSMVDRYAEITDIVGPLEKEKKRIAQEIRGLRGVTPAGTRVSLSEPSGWKDVPDLEAVAADYAASGRGLPTRSVPTSSPSLQVRRAKR